MKIKFKRIQKKLYHNHTTFDDLVALLLLKYTSPVLEKRNGRSKTTKQ